MGIRVQHGDLLAAQFKAAHPDMFAAYAAAARAGELRLRSIAVPPLGCGLGGLDWADVEPMVRRGLGALPGVEVLLYPPV
ncbi:macro domain-containing protein [Jiangella alba]|uniref:Macro domain-containing protein n=1 Tax=Jiangella alba TaxID=561176 RepID=A0A1H5IJB3_9ACTN|nr:macro domain-containing protein [Jiangella alba]SEE40316.1 hypothetical protein SAMN04488561_1219 [Jiangella alba]